MSLLLWTFWTYSFFGYLLERGYAAATRAAQPPGKGFLLLPLCPVYGLGALAVLALPAKYRVPIYLHYYEDYSCDEVAALLHIPGATVRTRLRRARALLKTDLQEAEQDV